MFYLEKTLKTTNHNDLVHLARIAIIFNYISLETLRDFYCNILGLKKNKLTRSSYTWSSFFSYQHHRNKIDLLLTYRKYVEFNNTKDMECFIDKLRIWRNLILHRSSHANKKYNQKLIIYLRGVNKSDIEKNFIKSKNCIEIMNYIMAI